MTAMFTSREAHGVDHGGFMVRVSVTNETGRHRCRRRRVTIV